MGRSNTIFPSVLNGIALAVIFQVSLTTLLSLKFWIVLGLMAGAVTMARSEGNSNG